MQQQSTETSTELQVRRHGNQLTLDCKVAVDRVVFNDSQLKECSKLADSHIKTYKPHKSQH
jgi:hypothetical protein